MVKRYIALRDRQKELDGQASSVKEEADALEQLLLDHFAEQSIDSMRVDGRTVYLRRQVWAKVPDGVDKAQIVSAFREAGLDHMVTPPSFNSNTVSSWMRDLEREGEALPPPLNGLLESSEVYNVRVRRS